MGEFRMPSLGADMEAGTLVEWLKQAGDTVARGDVIAVVETQKGAIEIEVFESGVLAEILVPVGQSVPVGTVIAMISSEGALATAKPAAKPVSAKAAAPEAPQVLPSTLPTQPAPLPNGAIKASPAARSLAAKHGIDLAGVRGSGPDGAIVFVDVESIARQPKRPATAGSAPMAKSPAREARGIDLGAMRIAIAAAMSRAKREIPHYYLSHTVDTGPAMEWLTETNAERPPAQRLVFGALMIKALALALREAPEFNGVYRDGKFEPSTAIHVGVAIAIRGGGLAAPAIHDCDQLALNDLMAKLRDLVGRVRAGRFRSSELTDATVTLTSLGERGVDAVTPVIYPPQVAILGAGTPTIRPWVVGERVVARPVVHLSLAGDHRVSDGHRGAMLLSTLGQLLQQPQVL